MTARQKSPLVLIDWDCSTTVFYNLLENSVKSTDQSGKAWLTYKQVNGYLETSANNTDC